MRPAPPAPATWRALRRAHVKGFVSASSAPSPQRGKLPRGHAQTRALPLRAPPSAPIGPDVCWGGASGRPCGAHAPLQATPLPVGSANERHCARRRAVSVLRAAMAAVAAPALFLLLLLCAAAGPARCWDQPGEMRGAGASVSAGPSAASPATVAVGRGRGGLSRPSAAQRCWVSGGLVRVRGRAGACAGKGFGYGLA